MQIKFIFNVAVLGFLLSACNSSYHFAEFITPSEIYVPTKIYAVGILNRGPGANSSMPIYTNGVPTEFIKGFPHKVAEGTLESLSNEAENLNRYRFVNIDWMPEGTDKRPFLEAALSEEVIDSLCQKYSLDGIISLDGVELSIRTNGEVNVVTANDEDGNTVRVPEFNSEQQVSYTVAWRFYDGYTLKPIDDFQETYQRIFNQISYAPPSPGKVDPAALSLMDVAMMAAADYLDRISPHWTDGQRLYYRYGSAELAEISQNFIYSGDWQKAATEWVKLTDNPDPKIRYFASYNMAVASEMLGKPRVAKDWLQTAIKAKPTSQARKYMETVDRQIVIYDVVDRQLGL